MVSGFDTYIYTGHVPLLSSLIVFQTWDLNKINELKHISLRPDTYFYIIEVDH